MMAIKKQRLRTSWKRTAGHLERARARLVAESPEASLDQFAEYVAHNELGLALDELVGAGAAADAPLDFWAAAQDAVDEMELRPDDPTHGESARTVAARLQRDK